VEQKAPLSRSADGAGRTILAIVSDLLIEVRIEAAAQRQGIAIKTAMAQDAVALITDSKFALVMADLAVVSNLESLAAAAQAANVEVVAFYPHVDTDLRKAARDAGIDYVYPRSRFLRELPKILAARLQP
jgi:hypothetical protein